MRCSLHLACVVLLSPLLLVASSAIDAIKLRNSHQKHTFLLSMTNCITRRLEQHQGLLMSLHSAKQDVNLKERT
eukprot:1311104-Amphidinium_carterae.1